MPSPTYSSLLSLAAGYIDKATAEGIITRQLGTATPDSLTKSDLQGVMVKVRTALSLYVPDKDRRQGNNGIPVRVIEYTLEGVANAEPIYRLLTSILDPDQAPAEELAALYHERWEIETALDELKTHLRGSKIVLRSKTPDLVRQEFYGLMMTHFAVRGLMHEAALKAREDPDRLSFLHAVRVVRRKLSQFVAIPPSAEKSVS